MQEADPDGGRGCSEERTDRTGSSRLVQLMDIQPVTHSGKETVCIPTDQYMTFCLQWSFAVQKVTTGGRFSFKPTLDASDFPPNTSGCSARRSEVFDVRFFVLRRFFFRSLLSVQICAFMRFVFFRFNRTLPRFFPPSYCAKERC